MNSKIRLAISACPLLLFAALCDWPPAVEAADPFTVRADRFDRGNVRASAPGAEYADRYPCIWNAGQIPNYAEYDLDFPFDGEYSIDGLYAAADSRPVDLEVDGVKVHRGFADVTGSWQTSTARWKAQCRVRLTKGRHAIRLVCPGPCMPHICALRFTGSVPLPPGWRLRRPAARPPSAGPQRVTPRAHGLLARAVFEPEASIETEVLSREDAEATGPAARDELLADFEPDEPLASSWVARIILRQADGTVEEGRLDPSPERMRRMLDHARWLASDYEDIGGARPELLAAWRAEADRLAAAIGAALPEPDGPGRARRLLDLYVATFRLEARLVLANPLLDFDHLLVVRRGLSSPSLGLPQNWQSNCALPRAGFDDEIAMLSPLRPGCEIRTLHRPQDPVFAGDLDLHFDGDRILFSSIGSRGRWEVFEIGIDGKNLRQVTPGDQPDVDSYDACYLPDGGIAFTSTAAMVAVPCVNGSTRVANLFRMEADGSRLRQLCFDQEHDWCPSVLADGRILYQRWEYTDTPHAHARLLFHMNPDGTDQREFSGSNSYWPNAMFYARAVPGHPTKFVCIVGGHHGVPRMGELTVFDAARGRREATGVVGRIPGRGKRFEPVIADNLVDGSWPKFLHPYPLGEHYFLVAAQETPGSLWGIYLADTGDGMFLLRDEPGHALLEPIPVRRTARPPVIPDRTDPARKDGTVQLLDVYAGGGLAGVPRGTVKGLRVLSYHFLYPGMGGPQGVVGMEGPWDIKRILGTVPVEEDGSAWFRVPANTPISVQPLDAEGKALQLMRSWFTAMPGETVSCVGCHEGQDAAPPLRPSLAGRRPPSEIAPWRGPARGFNFAREVQPVLDRHCVRCHDGRPSPCDQPSIGGRSISDLRGDAWIRDYTSLYHHGGADAGHFTVSYAELHRYVRRPGLESDYRLLAPLEFHADTTRLVQLLRKGHGGTALDPESWDRLITWIDLNAPFHGTWQEIAGEARAGPPALRRREMLKLYGGIEEDPEAVFPAVLTDPVLSVPVPADPVPIDPVPTLGAAVSRPEGVSCQEAIPCPGWPFDSREARRRQEASGLRPRTVDLCGGVSLELVPIPSGEFVLGDDTGDPDERPRSRVRIEAPFWVGRLEVTNEQFARYDPGHDSRVESKHAMQFGVRGFYVNGPRQPVVRVSWRRAMGFCAWLSARTGERFTLPTEAQWEYACRAGTETAFSFGGPEADFSPHANLADRKLREFVCDPYNQVRAPFPNPGKYDDWIPKDERFDDGGFLSEDAGRYRPNAWGLQDIHGNVAEWTRSAYRPYPYRDDDGRNDPAVDESRAVRGGSWRDKPMQARSASRLPYRPYQPVFNVGFRVVCEVAGDLRGEDVIR